MADPDWAGRWERACRESYPSVYRALSATLLDSDAAADALQDAFVEGLRRPPRTQANLAGWLYAVGLRRANRRRGIAARLTALLFPWRDVTGSDELERVLDRLSVGELLRLLTERQRTIVVAHYYLDLSQQEIASMLGVRRGTVAATLSQALSRMRQGGIDV